MGGELKRNKKQQKKKAKGEKDAVKKGNLISCEDSKRGEEGNQRRKRGSWGEDWETVGGQLDQGQSERKTCQVTL